MSNFYVIYDKSKGKVLQTHAAYELGGGTVKCDEAELYEMAKEEFGADADIAVARLPDDFDPADRTCQVAIKNDQVTLVPRKKSDTRGSTSVSIVSRKRQAVKGAH